MYNFNYKDPKNGCIITGYCVDNTLAKVNKINIGYPESTRLNNQIKWGNSRLKNECKLHKVCIFLSL